jgi:hypothetical protein
MTALNLAPSAMLEGAAGTRPAQPHWSARRRILVLMTISSALAVGALASAEAHGVSGGTMSGSGMPGTGAGMGTTAQMSSVVRLRNAPSIRLGFHSDRFAGNDGNRLSFDRLGDFGRFHHHHHHHHGGFFPFGFFAGGGWPGWPTAQPDMAADDEADELDWLRARWRSRYERPTVEKTPSGVTVIRGPGSHHF